jgi:hypothetical protein
MGKAVEGNRNGLYVKVLSQLLPGWIEENHENLTLTSVLAKI